jgi:hypothetical protein
MGTLTRRLAEAIEPRASTALEALDADVQAPVRRREDDERFQRPTSRTAALRSGSWTL